MDKLSGESRKQIFKWKTELGEDYLPNQCRNNRGLAEIYLRMIDHALRTFRALVVDLSISSWISRACAKHQFIHDWAQIPKLVASYYRKSENVTHRTVPLVYYYDQLIVDFRHILWQPEEQVMSVTVPPVNAPSHTASSAASSRTVLDHQVWHQQYMSRQRAGTKPKTADDYFQEVARE
jgi:hypothetical protein